MKGQKRSLSISGHRTSVSLEEPFWAGLKAMAEMERCSLADIVGRIDAGRGSNNLSSALRLRVLAHYQNEADATKQRS
jgi:predicted DNA-binding ribbon-helix-helix protein